MKRLAVSMGLLGAAACIIQVVFVRELLVAVYGNELSIGIVLGCWLIAIGAGALLGRMLGRDRVATPRLWVAPTVLAALLPAQVWGLRGVRALLHIGPGELVPGGAVFVAAALLCLPTGLCIGLVFPWVCRRSACIGRPDTPDANVAWIYTAEAAGGMLGGALLTFVLLGHLSAAQVMAVAMALSLGAAGCLASAARLRGGLLALGGLGILLCALNAPPLPQFNRALDVRRWTDFGLIGQGRATLVTTRDTVYQNLAVIEQDGQRALFTDGKAAYVYPDDLGDEHRVHFWMSMNPSARRVLLLGGNPAGDIRELLAYPLEQLVVVQLDPGIYAMVDATHGSMGAIDDPRLTRVTADAPRYIKACEARFDVIIVSAPEPTTAGAGRYFSQEFFRDVQKLLTWDGYMVTQVTTSERLQDDAALMGATVFRTLRSVFRVVLPTAETETRFFCGSRRILPDGSPRLTFDRPTLLSRGQGVALDTDYWRAEYVLGADEIDIDKTRHVTQRLRRVDAPISTLLQPAAYASNLRLWSRFSGSGIEQTLARLASIDGERLATGLLWGGGLFAVLGTILLRVRPGCNDVLARSTCLGIILTTGCFSMAMNIVLIMAYQGLYGTLYTRMGLFVGVFMLGLVIGAPVARRVSRWGTRWVRGALLGAEGMLVVAALAVPRVMLVAERFSTSPRLAWCFEALILVMVAGLGSITGFEFPAASRLFVARGGRVDTAAALSDAADHVGAACGAIAAGVVLMPALGMEGACRLLGALKLAGLIAGSAVWFTPIRRR